MGTAGLSYWLAVCCLALAGIWAYRTSSATTKSWAAAAGFAILTLWCLRSERRRYGSFGLASPLSLYALFWFLYFGLLGLGSIQLPSNFDLGLSPEQVLRALWISLISLVLIAVGYRAVTRLPRSVNLRTGRWHVQDVNPWLLATSLLAGWTATGYLIRSGKYGYLQFGQAPSTGAVHLLITMTAGLVPLSLAILGLVMWSGSAMPSLSKRAARWCFAGNLPLLVASALASGVKGQLITDLIPVGIVFLMVKGRAPWMALIALGLFLVVSFGGIQDFRANISSGSVSPQQRTGLVAPTSQALSDIAHSWTAQNPARQVKAFWHHVSDEYAATPQDLALIVQRTPDQVPYVTARRFLAGPLFFLPTSWMQPSGFDLTQYVSVTYRQAPPSTSTPPTQPGDFFMSGGWPAVVTGELGVGVFLGLVWRLLVARRPDDRRLVLYAIVASGFATTGLDWVGLVRGTLQALALYALLLPALFPARSVPERSGG